MRIELVRYSSLKGGLQHVACGHVWKSTAQYVKTQFHNFMSAELMSTARSLELISVDDYLQGELTSENRHEYVAGVVHAMTGGTVAHAKIAMNCAAGLHSQLSGQPCDVFGSDARIRVKDGDAWRFYYPDISVNCEPTSQSDLFQDTPVVVIEVLSDSTRRIDEEEKREAFCSIPSLRHYILVEQNFRAAIVYSRDSADSPWERNVVSDPNSAIALPEISAELPLRVIYDGIEIR